MPKRTFHKKLYELIENKLVERTPPSNTPTAHIGKKVTFKLTPNGEKTVKIQETLTEFETQYQNILEKLVERSLQIGKTEPLTGSTLYLTSQTLPIFTIAHLPSKEQYEKLRAKITNDTIREELGKLINRLIEFYTENVNDGLYSASYLKTKQVVFFMGFLPEKETNMIEELISQGLFENEYTLTRGLMKTTFFAILHSIYSKLKTSQKFREGKEGLVFPFGCYYNPKTKAIEPLPKSKLEDC